MISRPRCAAAWTALAGAFGALFVPALARAQVGIDSTVTQIGALTHYSYLVTNPASAANELAIVSLQGALNDSPTNLSAPTGFFTSYDPGNGLFSFAPTNDASMGAFSLGSATGPFSFDSSFAAGSAPYEALDSQGNSFTGTTMAPAAAVPEANTLILLAIGGVGLTFAAARARRRASGSAS